MEWWSCLLSVKITALKKITALLEEMCKKMIVKSCKNTHIFSNNTFYSSKTLIIRLMW